MKTLLTRRKIVLIIILLLLITSVISPVYGSPIQIDKIRNSDLLKAEEASDDIIEFEPVRRPWLFTFSSYIDFDIDTSVLENPLELEVSISVPVTIKYWTDIPSLLWKIIPWPLSSIILFRRIIGPMQKIFLGIKNVPDWADIYFSNTEIMTYVPFSDDLIEVTSNLIIRVGKDAPGVSYRIDLIAFCGDIGRLNGVKYQDSLGFTPSYNPCLKVKAPQFTECPRNQTTVILVNMANCGNKISTVEVSIPESPEGFLLTFIPDYYLIEVDETKQGFLKIKPPNDFIGDEIIPIEFYVERYPYKSGSAKLNFIFYLVVRVI